MSKRTATIAISTTTSGTVDLTPTRKAVGLYLPAALTGTSMTFLVSHDNSTFVIAKAMDGASSYSVTVGTNRYVPLDDRVMRGVRYIQLVSGSTETAARSIVIDTAYRIG